MPAALKWQPEKQPAERGLVMRVGAVRFDPRRRKFEVDDLALADGQGAANVGFDNLMINLEWRRITDRAWTIAQVRLPAPHVPIDRARHGSHHFSTLRMHFAGTEPQLDRLSTLDDEPVNYRVSVCTAAGESLELHGNIAIESRHATGELALRALQVSTLAPSEQQ